MTSKNTLVIDIGNSYIKIGLFKENDELIHKCLLVTKLNLNLDTIKKILVNEFYKNNVDYSIIGSVVPVITNVFQLAIKDIFKIDPYLINNRTKLSFELGEDINIYDVGQDILALSQYCTKKFNHSIGFSFGTAIFGVYLKDNKLVGVSIAPGIGFSFDYLISKITLINDVEYNKYKNINYGRSTISSLESGINHIRSGFVNSFYNSIKSNSQIDCVLTGGEVFDIDVNFKYIIDNNAILLGFKYINELNIK